MIWRRSQKVVCIADGKWEVEAPFTGDLTGKKTPVKGVVYEIWDIIHYHEIPDLVFLALVEFPGFGCDARSFRPAVDRQTDISIFTKALLPSTPNLERVP